MKKTHHHHWTPRILTQGYFMVGPDGGVYSPMMEGEESPSALLYFNTWEINPEGFKTALSYARRHLGEYAGNVVQRVRGEALACHLVHCAKEMQREGKLADVGDLDAIHPRQGLAQAYFSLVNTYPALANETVERSEEVNELVTRAEARLAATPLNAMTAEEKRILKLGHMLEGGMHGANGEPFYGPALTDPERERIVVRLAEALLSRWEKYQGSFLANTQRKKDETLPYTWRHAAANLGDRAYNVGLTTLCSRAFKPLMALAVGTGFTGAVASFGMLASGSFPVDPEITANMAMYGGQAFLTGAAVVAVPMALGPDASHLVSHAPEWSHRRAARAIRRAQERISESPEAAKQLFREFDPLFIVATHQWYVSGNGTQPTYWRGAATRQGEAGNTSILLAECAMRGKYGRKFFTEETLHQVEANVYEAAGVSPPMEEFSKAFKRDTWKYSARRLMWRYGNKPWLCYFNVGYRAAESHGAEVLVELDMIRHRMMEREKIDEPEAMARIAQAFPRCYPLFEAYVKLEDQVFGEAPAAAPVPANDDEPTRFREAERERRQRQSEKREK